MTGKHYRPIAVGLAILCAFLLPSAGAFQSSADATSEDDLRAAFILNFARFITWPGEYPDNPAPLVIGVWGDPGLASALDRVVNGQTVRGRKLTVLTVKEFARAGEVNILYLPSARQRQLGPWLMENAGTAILTISGDRSFCKQGGMIALYPEGRRIRFEINQESMQRGGLRASSKLLALARSGGGQ